MGVVGGRVEGTLRQMCRSNEDEQTRRANGRGSGGSATALALTPIR